MPTPKKGARLGGSPAHQKLILANLATQLIEHRAITTTEAKAKTLQPFVEKLVTKARRGDMHARRTVAKTITDKDAVYELFDVIAPAIDPERAGGYTRLTRVGNRRGDNAPMMRIELVLEKVEKKAVVAAADRTAAKAAAEESEDNTLATEAAEAEVAADERAEEAREVGDLEKANEADELAAEAGKEVDAAEEAESEVETAETEAEASVVADDAEKAAEAAFERAEEAREVGDLEKANEADEVAEAAGEAATAAEEAEEK